MSMRLRQLLLEINTCPCVHCNCLCQCFLCRSSDILLRLILLLEYFLLLESHWFFIFNFRKAIINCGESMIKLLERIILPMLISLGLVPSGAHASNLFLQDPWILLLILFKSQHWSIMLLKKVRFWLMARRILMILVVGSLISEHIILWPGILNFIAIFRILWDSALVILIVPVVWWLALSIEG